MAQKERSQRDNWHDREERDNNIVDRIVSINRVSTALPGGRRFAFSVLVVIGDTKSKVGFAHSTAREVPEAVRKATEAAKNNMISVSLLEGRTLHHDITGSHGAGKVIMRSAKAGTGVIAGGPVRAVCEVLGIHDVVAKSVGSSNSHNVVRAVFKALRSQSHPRDIAARRGIKHSSLQARRASTVSVAKAGTVSDSKKL
ncbi:30S ribosomal protein S5 [Candidatus Liberibacter americanus]|uniref:Small ribosomal subunit protein uS5 n=1 Tax=Candidatus Liberibacter americanus str. Sao Paulo TaxID=1261131 RepID=U6B5U5_9HYPH|nr:30S ribosomal protein S5 [Candidatus Liberibacter americanus]AHA28258.1 Ribosomal protein S5 [Candidatus Liberibacter americanus str. Sao Paulo]EMS36228.1 30S ribosomal protein S5 [Candidatus Liberibacter americanus PW_SP]